MKKLSIRLAIVFLAAASMFAAEPRLPFRLPVFDCLMRADMIAHSVATTYCAQVGCMGGGPEWQAVYAMAFQANSGDCWLPVR